MNRNFAKFMLIAVIANVLNIAAAHAASITSISSTQCSFCNPLAVSANGSVIAGEIAQTRWYYIRSDGWFESFLGSSGHYYPMLWTQEDGVNRLHVYGYGTATALTSDGSMVVGRENSGTSFAGGDTPYVPFRWTEASGLVSLGRPTGIDSAGAFGMSADGSTIMIETGRCSAGGCWVGGGPFFRWTQDGGFVPLGFSGWSGDVSADGSVIVGTTDVQIDEFTQSRQGFRWSAATGAVGLGTLNGDFSSDATAVSADGSVVVGETYGGHAFRWTAAIGMLDLGQGGASDVSADGSIVVGTNAGEAFYWTQAGGMRLLRDVLQDDFGLDMSDWSLDSALAISADGHTIVGRGYGPAGNGIWIANLAVPEPSSAAIGLAGLILVTMSRNRKRFFL